MWVVGLFAISKAVRFSVSLLLYFAQVVRK